MKILLMKSERFLFLHYDLQLTDTQRLKKVHKKILKRIHIVCYLQITVNRGQKTLRFHQKDLCVVFRR